MEQNNTRGNARNAGGLLEINDGTWEETWKIYLDIPHTWAPASGHHSALFTTQLPAAWL